MMMMTSSPLLTAAFVAAMVLVASAADLSATTAPAFLWSPHFTDSGVKDAVNYQIVTPKDLAKSVLTEGGLSNLVCSSKKVQQPLDLLVVFVGKELQSSDISGNKQTDAALVDLLKESFTKSNYSMAFPYVAASDEETMTDALVSGFTEGCGNDLEISKTSFEDLHSAHDYLLSRADKKVEGKADLVVIGNSESRAESQVFSELIGSIEQSGAKYTVLYVSDPFRSILQYPSYRQLGRFLAEGSGNSSANLTTCDEVCQFKSSLLEGVLVGIVLLIILISGLCCMAGIDTPTRFETPQES